MGKRLAPGSVFLVLAFVASARADEAHERELEKRVSELEARLKKVDGRDASTAPKPAEKPDTTTAPEQAPPSVPDRLARIEKDLRRAFLAAQVERLELTGGVDADYTWNVNGPPFRLDANRLRVTNPDSNTFELAWGKLGVARTVSGEDEWDAGARFEIAFGRQVAKTLSLDPQFLFFDKEVNFAQGYVDLQAPTPANALLLRFGRFYSWFGAESLDPWKNPNFSHAWTFVFTPFTTTGFGLGMDLGEGFRYTQYVVNGWDVVVDDNKSKSVGGQLSWTRTDDPKAAVAFNWLFGPEIAGNNHSNRVLVELAGVVRPFEGTEFRLVGNLGYEEPADSRSGRSALFGGVTIIASQEFVTVDATMKRFGAALRGTYYRDQGGVRTLFDQALGEVTGTLWMNCSTFAKLRVEYRQDISTKDFFFGHSGRLTQPLQGTISVDAVLAF